jgi:hypothetical protein
MSLLWFFVTTMQPPTEKEIKRWKHLVVHKSRNPYDVYVGRPTKWGNPFHMNREEDRDYVCNKFDIYISNCEELTRELPELKGKVLACWCAPKRCHAYTLAALANREA